MVYSHLDVGVVVARKGTASMHNDALQGIHLPHRRWWGNSTLLCQPQQQRYLPSNLVAVIPTWMQQSR